jgi:hypothetical protein
MTNNVGSPFIVGDTIPRFTISNRARQLELVTLTIIFSVLPTRHVQCDQDQRISQILISVLLN